MRMRMKENLQIKLSQLEDECENLKSLLAGQEELPAPVSEAIKERIEMLNSLFASQITENDCYAKPYKLWTEKILKDKEKFMDSTRMAFMVSHPRFMKYLEDLDLYSEKTKKNLIKIGDINGSDLIKEMKTKINEQKNPSVLMENLRKIKK